MKRNQQGYALYLVTVVCSILFVLLAVVITSLQTQAEAIQARENQIRANNLILSALSLWKAEEWMNDALSTETKTFSLEDGTVTLTLVDMSEKHVVIKMHAFVNNSQANREVRVTLSAENGQIVDWETL
jgi:Na+-transporting NADH:ubiquinone oxidoreductase subunit NqrC